jgi:hypothetical protein
MNLKEYFADINEEMPTDQDQLLDYVRWIRKSYFRGSDWTQMPDSPLSEADKALWATYRQQLRDITNVYEGHLEDTVFPEPPFPW